jgi:hypothetical protein
MLVMVWDGILSLRLLGILDVVVVGFVLVVRKRLCKMARGIGFRFSFFSRENKNYICI